MRNVPSDDECHIVVAIVRTNEREYAGTKCPQKAQRIIQNPNDEHQLIAGVVEELLLTVNHLKASNNIMKII